MRNINIRRFRKTRPILQDGTIRGEKELKSSTSFLAGDEKKYFGWGKIIKRRSETCDVDVILDNGMELRHVGVASREWAGSNSEGFGERDLPPEDALVLIAFPYGTMDDALVLCSGFTVFGKHATKWKTELLTSGKETEALKIREGGLKETYDKSTGAYKLTVNEAEIEITATGAVNIKAKTGQAININGGPNVVINNGTIGVNDFPNCPVTGALHCIAAQAIKVP